VRLGDVPRWVPGLVAMAVGPGPGAGCIDDVRVGRSGPPAVAGVTDRDGRGTPVRQASTNELMRALLRDAGAG